MRLAVIGNCQVQSLAAIIAHMLDGPALRIWDYSQAYSRDEEGRRIFAESLADCDLILAQTAAASHTGERDLRDRYGSRVVTIANFYFRGLFPDSCYVGGFGARVEKPSTVNSVIVLDSFRRGLSEAQAVRSFTLETLDRLHLLSAWEESMAEMRRREANGTIDVPAAALIEEACRLYPAFHTMNHPTATLLAEYLGRVFRHLGLRYQPVNPALIPDPLAAFDTSPVLDMVAEYLKLPYRTSQLWKINGELRRFLDHASFVSAFYAAYREQPREKLLVNSPSDLAARYRENAALAYLVDAGAAAPDEAPPEADLLAGSGGALAEFIRFELRQALRPAEQATDEIRTYVHKVHSYLEILDPKVERIFRHILKLESLAESRGGHPLFPAAAPGQRAASGARFPMLKQLLVRAARRGQAKHGRQ